MDKKQLKRIFNKNIFKDKSFIKMVCFTIVLLLVLVLGNNFGYVSADSAYNECLNQTDWQASANYSIPRAINPPIAFHNGFCVDLYANLSDLDFSNIDWGGRDSVKYYYIAGNASFCYVYLFNEVPYVLSDNRGTYIYSYGDCFRFLIGYATTGSSWWDFYIDPQSFNVVTPYSSDNNLNSFFIGSGNNFYSVYANCPLYVPASDWQSGNSFVTYPSAFISSVVNGNNDSHFINYNYLFDAGEIQGFNGLNNLVGLPNNNSGANESNYMYVDYADWYLNNYTANIPSNFRNMSVSFTSNLNDYINQQLASEDGTNPSDWVIYVDYSAFIDFYYKSVTDYGNVQLSSSLPENFANVSYTTPDISSTTVYHWAASYEFPLYNNSDLGYNSAFDNVFHSPYNGYTTGFFMDGYKFANTANYVWTCPFSGLFAYMSPTSNSKFTNSNGVTYSIDVSLYEIMQMVDANMINWSPEYEGLNQFKLTCDAQIMYVGDDSTVDFTSGWYSETFNLLTGESITGSNAMLTNYNPYVDNTTEDYSENLPSTSSGSSSTSVTTGNVTQTVTVSNEGAKYIPSIISYLIPSSFGDTTTGLASRFTTLVDSNNFITVMANTVPAIPTTVWTYLTEYLGISLYLLACAFVLRLILDLL